MEIEIRTETQLALQFAVLLTVALLAFVQGLIAGCFF
jgi:hypothetical protein